MTKKKVEILEVLSKEVDVSGFVKYGKDNFKSE